MEGFLSPVIGTLANRQYGMLGRRQLLEAGVPADTLRSWLRRGRLYRVHRGVYSLTTLSVPVAREMAALLACGAHAVLCSRTAAALWKMLRIVNECVVEVMVTRGRVSDRRGIRVRTMHTLRPAEITMHDGLRVTTPARTLYDLATFAPGRDLEQALAEALVLRIVDRSAILAVLAGRDARPGTARLRRLLDSDAPIAFTRSEAEKRFLELVRRARFDPPLPNARVKGYEVDFLWPAERVVVEVDGRAFHSNPRRFESDRRRDAALLAAGMRVMRVTWKQLVNESEAVVADLTRVLLIARYSIREVDV